MKKQDILFICDVPVLANISLLNKEISFEHKEIISTKYIFSSWIFVLENFSWKIWQTKMHFKVDFNWFVEYLCPTFIDMWRESPFDEIKVNDKAISSVDRSTEANRK